MKKKANFLNYSLVLGAALGFFSVNARADSPAPRPQLQASILNKNPTGNLPAGYNPFQIRHAYGFDLIANQGAGQKIAVIDAFGAPSIAASVNAFSKFFGLPNVPLQVSAPAKFNKSGETTASLQTWAWETALDVEWAHSAAPQATIILSVAASGSYADLMNAVERAIKLGATTVSMSWGGAEDAAGPAFFQQYDAIFAKYPNITFVAASGDGGAASGCSSVDAGNPDCHKVQWPSSSPYVISVGGTSLELDANGNRTGAEIAWIGSGGGVSLFEPQTAGQASLHLPGTLRAVPDVSYNADPNTGYYVYATIPGVAKAQWAVFGGTSVGAPQWASLFTIARSTRAHENPKLGALDFATAIYSLSTSSTGLAEFFQPVNSGCNTNLSIIGTCATPGFDDVTGLGTPRADQLLNVAIPGSLVE
jgi:subtilase family serine protease